MRSSKPARMDELRVVTLSLIYSFCIVTQFVLSGSTMSDLSQEHVKLCNEMFRCETLYEFFEREASRNEYLRNRTSAKRDDFKVQFDLAHIAVDKLARENNLGPCNRNRDALEAVYDEAISMYNQLDADEMKAKYTWIS